MELDARILIRGVVFDCTKLINMLANLEHPDSTIFRFRYKIRQFISATKSPKRNKITRVSLLNQFYVE